MIKMKIFILLACVILANYSNGQVTRYEAEDAKLYNGANISDASSFSGGKKVGWLGGSKNGTIEFNNIEAQFTGFHKITISYASADNRNLNISCNDGEGWQIVCVPTAGWDVPGPHETYVFLNKGSNTIKIDNPYGNAPDLDCIDVDHKQYTFDLYSATGVVTNASGEPVVGITLKLSGTNGYSVKTDNEGKYTFKIFPETKHTILPVKAGSFFIPSNIYIDGNTAVDENKNFIVKKIADNYKDTVFIQGNWKIQYFPEISSAHIYYKNKLLIPYSYSEYKIENTISSRQYTHFSFFSTPISNMLGNGNKLEVKFDGNNEMPELIQEYLIYEDYDGVFTRTKLVKTESFSTNYIAPLVCDSIADFLGGNEKRVLAVPFDNDSWVKYDAQPYTENVTSYEVSAIFDNTSRNGLVIGSVEHNLWKTGITSAVSNNIRDLRVFGGITSPLTRDILEHGMVSGDTVSSPLIYIGFGNDWRKLMETYASINNTIAPGPAWDKPKPFGWNSWGIIQKNLSFSRATAVSDFFANELQPKSFNNEGMVYIGLDSYWDRLSDSQLKSFVDKCKHNGQEAGIYWAPFTYWGGDDSRTVEGSNGSYKYRDVYLYADGKKQIVDGAPAVDPTHPAIKDRAIHYISRFKEAGFSYIKLDFLGHGALEADEHFDTTVTTGIQAYNMGMKHVLDLIDGSMFINESIAPLFPSNYAHSRRIACDTYSSISETEYALNSLTYGWWLSYAYSFNDADHVVLAGKTEGENRARVTSSAITGIFIAGDDFSTNGNPDGKEKAKKFLTNPDINNMAKIKKSFMPVEGNTDNKSSNLFTFNDSTNNRFYLAAFNFESATLTRTVDFSRIGLNIADDIFVKELWTGKVTKAKGSINLNIPGRDAEVYMFSTDSLNDSSTGLGMLKNNNIKLFPNPASDIITAQISNNIDSIHIFNIEGKQAINICSIDDNLVTVNLSYLNTGLYFIKITDNEGNSSFSKFIKSY